MGKQRLRMVCNIPARLLSRSEPCEEGEALGTGLERKLAPPKGREKKKVVYLPHSPKGALGGSRRSGEDRD